MYFNDNSAGTNDFGYPTPGSNTYPFETAGGESSTSVAQTSGSDLDPTLDTLSTAEIENWWLAPKQDGGAGQYTGSTLLDSSWGEFAGLYDTQAGCMSGTVESKTGKSYRPSLTQCSTLIIALDDGFGLNALGQRYVDVSENAEFSTAGSSTAPYPARPAQLPSPPATFTGPATTPSPVPTLSWGCKCLSYL